MDMLLMGLCLSVFGVAVSALAFAATMRTESSPPAVQPELPAVKAAAPARFFLDRVAVPPAISAAQVPIEILLLQIENHVRLEQAAAESFIASPTHAHLHSKTPSPFVN